MGNWKLLLVDLAKIQYKRDGEGPDLWIKTNIDNELYCYFNEFTAQYAKLGYRTWLAYLPSGIKSSSSYAMFKAKPDEYYINKLNSDIAWAPKNLENILCQISL